MLDEEYQQLNQNGISESSVVACGWTFGMAWFVA
jgi:hypothetical protein